MINVGFNMMKQYVDKAGMTDWLTDWLYVRNTGNKGYVRKRNKNEL